MVMLEKNNREALQPILTWMKDVVEAKGTPAIAANRGNSPIPQVIAKRRSHSQR